MSICTLSGWLHGALRSATSLLCCACGGTPANPRQVIDHHLDAELGVDVEVELPPGLGLTVDCEKLARIIVC